MRRALFVSVATAFGARTLRGERAPFQPEYKLGVLLSQYGLEVHTCAHIDGTTDAVNMMTWNVQPLFQLPERPPMPLLLLPS